MKKKFKNRKEFQEIAQIMGIEDVTQLTGQVDTLTKAPRLELLNNARRFVNGLLKLSPSEQTSRIAEFRKVIASVQAEEALKNVNG